MKVKEVQRTAALAWSPAPLQSLMLAAGTSAQAVDASFSTAAALEIYAVNLTEPGPEMELKCTVASDHRFHKVVWGAYGIGGKHPSGVVVGGCEGGAIQVYSADSLLGGGDALLARPENHTGPVRALDLNPFQHNLLASGSTESEIYVWDLNNIATPMAPGAKATPLEEVQSVAWNRQVQHILASAFPSRCVVWDLRKNEPIIKLSDSQSRVRWRSVVWHPEVATQLALASEEDQAPLVQLWDLRFATAPLRVLQRHQHGVLALAWCAQDSDLLMSCGKDTQLLIWNPSSELPGGEVISELPCSTQWNFDLSWCPRNPALVATSSCDGYIAVHSLMGGSQQQVQTSNKIADSFPGMDHYAQATPAPAVPLPAAQALTKAPKWLRRPLGASFGFGGKLVSFSPPAAGEPRLVYISQVVTDPELLQRTQALEAGLQEPTGPAQYCIGKADAALDQHGRSLWYFLKAHFEDDPRSAMLDLLGYRHDDVVAKLSSHIVQKNKEESSRGAETSVDQLTDQMTGLSRSDSSEGEGDRSTDSNSTDLSGADTGAVFDAIAAGQKTIKEDQQKSSIPYKIRTGDDQEGLITQALITGKIEEAVELCFQAGRPADAIIVAMTGGSELLAQAQYRYLRDSDGCVSLLIGALVAENWSAVVEQSTPESWKEALVAVLTHSSREEMPVLCERLGERLESAGRPRDAILCYICAGAIGRVVTATTHEETEKQRDGLMDLVELASIMRKAAEQQGRTEEVSAPLVELLTRYALLLASQGSLDSALVHLGQSQQQDLAELRERLYCALGHKQAYGVTQTQQQPKNVIEHNRRTSMEQTRRASMQPRLSGDGYSHPAQNSLNNPLQPVFNPAQQGYTGQNTVFNTGLPNSFNPQQQPAQQPWQQNTGSALPPVVPFMPQSPPTGPPPTTQPPRPTSVGSGHGSSGTRSKYVVDPSVKSGPAVGAYGSAYPSQNNTTPYNNYANPASSMSPAGYMGQSQPVQPPMMFNAVPPQQQYNPATATAPALNPQPLGNYQQPLEVAQSALPSRAAPTPPPGWNDPPAPRNITRPQTKPDYAAQSPITHPLFGSQDPSIQLGVLGMSTQPPPPYNGYNSDPYAQQNGQQQQNQQQPYRQQQFNNAPMGVVAPVQQAPPPRPPTVEAPIYKGPVPEEHMYLQTVFDELREQCMLATKNPQTKRKLEDVARKLEVLYDMLRDNRLSQDTLRTLHQMVETVQIGNYVGGLSLHTSLVSGPEFAQIATFMPGLKVLIQSAMQLQVYLQ